MLIKQLIKVAKFTGAFRLAITLLTNRLNIIKALKDLNVTVRFTAACVLFSLIYHLMRRFVRHLRLKKKMNICRDLEVTLACGLGSLGLNVATTGDMGIFKILLLSRACGTAIRLLGNETGMFRPVEDPDTETRTWTVEAFLTITSCAFIAYSYIFMPRAMGDSFFHGFARLIDYNKDERIFFDTLRASEAVKKSGIKL